MFILMLHGVKKITQAQLPKPNSIFSFGSCAENSKPSSKIRHCRSGPRLPVCLAACGCCRRLQGTYRPPGAIFHPPKFLPPPQLPANSFGSRPRIQWTTPCGVWVPKFKVPKCGCGQRPHPAGSPLPGTHGRRPGSAMPSG